MDLVPKGGSAKAEPRSGARMRGPTTRERSEWSGPEDFGYWLWLPAVGVSWTDGVKRADTRASNDNRAAISRRRRTRTGIVTPMGRNRGDGFGRAQAR